MTHGRQCGRTSRQILASPEGAVFVCCNHQATAYTKDLARHLGRGDLEIVSPSWLSSQCWRGSRFTGITLDHFASEILSNAERRELHYARERRVASALE